MISVKDKCSQNSACSYGSQSHQVSFSWGIIAVKQKIAKNKSGMICHYNIMTAQKKKGKDADSVDDQFSKKSGGVCQSGSKCKNTENNGKGCQRSRHLHSEIGIPEDHDTKKNNNAYDTVFVSEDFAVAHYKGHAEDHGNENLEQINRNMAQLFASGG